MHNKVQLNCIPQLLYNIIKIITINYIDVLDFNILCNTIISEIKTKIIYFCDNKRIILYFNENYSRRDFK